jgi:hypothetical protein
MVIKFFKRRVDTHRQSVDRDGHPVGAVPDGPDDARGAGGDDLSSTNQPQMNMRITTCTPQSSDTTTAAEGAELGSEWNLPPTNWLDEPYETLLSKEYDAYCLACDHRSNIILPKRADISTMTCPYCLQRRLV